MRELPQKVSPLLQGRRTVVASADRVLITALVHSFKDVGPIVGAATSQSEALSCLAANQANLLICSDLLDRGDGPALVAAAKQQQPSLRCLMLIQRPLLSTIEAAVAAGCEGLCSRDRVGNGAVLNMLQAMESDGSHMDPVISGVVQHRHRRADPASALTDVLNLREEDVLRGLCRGLTNEEIADQLHLSLNTVKHRITALLSKLNARDRTQAVLIAFRQGLVDPPTPIPRWKP